MESSLALIRVVAQEPKQEGSASPTSSTVYLTRLIPTSRTSLPHPHHHTLTDAQP